MATIQRLESEQVTDEPFTENLHRIKDKYNDLGEVEKAIRDCGLESSNIILGIDFTRSNVHKGERSFGGRCLHDVSDNVMNPYLKVIRAISEALPGYNEDNTWTIYAFGDTTTRDKTVAPILYRDRLCESFDEVQRAYKDYASRARLSGPTNFAPIINKAVEIVQQKQQYHILIIIADGEMTVPEQTTRAIVEASKWPLSIIVVGVGDGPWDEMKKYDDGLPERRFDNFQFVNYTGITENADNADPDRAFALHALMEIPDQFGAILNLGMLNWD